MIHKIHRLGDVDEPGDVMLDEEEVLVPQMADVPERSGIEIVDADDSMTARDEVIAEVGAEEPRSAGDNCGACSLIHEPIVGSGGVVNNWPMV